MDIKTTVDTILKNKKYEKDLMNNNLIILAAGISSRMKNSSVKGTMDSQLIEEANLKPKSMISVGDGGRPFMDYLLFHAAEAGYKHVVIVINERDGFTEPYYTTHETWGLDIQFARQIIPKGRSKPLGTADAVLQGLIAKPEWAHEKFTICNSDNLYSVSAFKVLREDTHFCAMIDYDRDGLGVEPERVNAFAVIWKDKDGFLEDIVEKPGKEDVERSADENGRIGVSMNIFRLDYDASLPELENCPLHPTRDEKELPTAIRMMMKKHLQAMFTIPVSERVPDLTSKEDILKVQKYLESLEIKSK